MNFHHNSKNKNLKTFILFFILFSTFRIFHKNLTSSEEGGGSAYPYLGQGPVIIMKLRGLIPLRMCPIKIFFLTFIFF